ncbi:MAG: DNA protecting protein DprA [Candidatus Lloydbacteria bacterium RIFCSPHIGHO2_01_FULL_49_22]|uniref:DNA protecting protein DprA n=1 Tax=Candidatus Lloydbacteria bacterium RIFCSPHIGHO2_01_FULL_49_22 TaxID=1798658 RepID=A0A1G2CXI1_9BACT|nr:MAG: DNA protecting protein DprA [Candidatus Lloydbacteria bacterium RIFCSPHIGHO2_01_FULL_49_22]OGZ10370.1 MAG: DNA protecting protein DprA [Candidatus Lloydbacteria bacterium RIFCSPHIGHO2_02_FULL_50_18]
MGYTIRQLSDQEFPPQLLEIPEPPKELWLAGELPSPDTVLLTVVGARKHTSYGREACEEIIAGLAGYDITIVSGLAIGIDAIAHESAIRAGLMTIAVPGSGLDPRVLYPRTNYQLAERILEAGGALLSEFAPDTPPAPWTFPKRNRIMAGLARATLLIEAQERSGTLITARLATDYNRELLVVPGSIFSPLSKGTNQFIALGATPVTSAADVLRALGFNTEDMAEKVEIDLSQFPSDERAVLELLTEPLERERLITQMGVSASDANVLLMRLEINGYISDTPEGIRRNYI